MPEADAPDEAEAVCDPAPRCRWRRRRVPVAGREAAPVRRIGSPTQYLTATAATGDVTAEVAATGTIASSDEYALGFGAAAAARPRSPPPSGSGTWSVTEVDAAVGQVVKQGDVLARRPPPTSSSSSRSSARRCPRPGSRPSWPKSTWDGASGTDCDPPGQDRPLQRRQLATPGAAGRRRHQGADRAGDPDGPDRWHRHRRHVRARPGFDRHRDHDRLDHLRRDRRRGRGRHQLDVDRPGRHRHRGRDRRGHPGQGRRRSRRCPAPAAATASSRIPVTVTLTGAPPDLRPGMSADISIVTASASNVLTIPSEALRGTTGDYRVQVMGADGTPTSTAVTVGLVTSTTAEIKSGLSAGEVVVTGTASDRTATSGATYHERSVRRRRHRGARWRRRRVRALRQRRCCRTRWHRAPCRRASCRAWRWPRLQPPFL